MVVTVPISMCDAVREQLACHGRGVRSLTDVGPIPLSLCRQWIGSMSAIAIADDYKPKAIYAYWPME